MTEFNLVVCYLNEMISHVHSMHSVIEEAGWLKINCLPVETTLYDIRKVYQRQKANKYWVCFL